MGDMPEIYRVQSVAAIHILRRSKKQAQNRFKIRNFAKRGAGIGPVSLDFNIPAIYFDVRQA